MSSRELEDFGREIMAAIKGIARDVDLVDDILKDIREDRKLEDLASRVIEDMFEDADRDDQLYSGRGDNFNTGIIDETTFAVLGVVADESFEKRDWEDLSDKEYKPLATGIKIYEDALDRLKDGKYDRDSGSSRRGSGGSSRRDSGGRRGGRRGGGDRGSSRREQAPARRSRPQRSSRRGDDTAAVRKARPYNSGAARRDRDGSNRDEHLSEEAISNMTSQFIDGLKDTGITDMAKLFSQMTDADITIEDLVAYRADRRDFNIFKEHKHEVLEYLETLSKPRFGGTATGSSAGLVLDDTRVLVNGEVQPVEHYMEHELKPEGRRANLARYGMVPERHVRVPVTVEEESRFEEVTQIAFTKLAPITVDRPYSELVDYNDAINACAEAAIGKDMAFCEVAHGYTAVLTFEQISDLLPYVNGQYIAPRSWNEMHAMMAKAAALITDSTDNGSCSPALTRMMGMLDDSATDYFNQCLTLSGASVTIANFLDDYNEGVEYMTTQPSGSKRDFFEMMKETFRDMFLMSVEPLNDGESLSYRVAVQRRTPMLYTAAPVIGKTTMLTNNTYNILTASHAPAVYEMVDSALRLRTNRAELVLVDQYDNRYAVNCVRTGAGMPILVREL